MAVLRRFWRRMQRRRVHPGELMAEDYRWRYWALLAAAQAVIDKPTPDNVDRLGYTVREVRRADFE